MKRRITPEQLLELTPEQQVKLWEWWKPEQGDCAIDIDDKTIKIIYKIKEHVESSDAIIYSKNGEEKFSTEYLLPLLDIGQMIELLQSNEDYSENQWWPDDRDFKNPALCDKLWETVKDMLIKT